MNQRFITITGDSIDDVVQKLNEHSLKVVFGRVVYFGPSMPFDTIHPITVVIDYSYIPVLTREDILDLNEQIVEFEDSFKDDRSNAKLVSSA